MRPRSAVFTSARFLLRNHGRAADDRLIVAAKRQLAATDEKF